LKSPAGWTVLMLAAWYGRDNVVKELLDRGADVNAKSDDYDQTALMFAATKCSTDTIIALIDKGADVNAKPAKGKHGIFGTTGIGQEVNSPNIITEKGMTALMLAAASGRADNVIALLDNGADVNARNENGRTALMWAARSWRGAAAVKALLDNGADVSAKDEKGNTAITAVKIQKGKADGPAIVKLLKQAGAKE